MRKRVLSLCMALAMCLSLLPPPALASELSEAATETPSEADLSIAVETVESATKADTGAGSEATVKDSSVFSGLNCHEMTKLWFGETDTATLLGAGAIAKTPEDVVNAYFFVRESNFPGTVKLLDANDIPLSDEMRKVCSAHLDGIQVMESRHNMLVKDADVTVRIDQNRTIYDGDVVIVYAYEWTFFDYSDLYNELGGTYTSGYGTNHKITLVKTDDIYSILSDEYDESDLTGICTLSGEMQNETEETSSYFANNAYPETSGDDSVELLSLDYFRNYDVAKAVAYADKYTSDGPYDPKYYNSEYEDFTLKGGDCTNYVSQCLYAGGVPEDDVWWHSHKKVLGIPIRSYSTAWKCADGLQPWLVRHGGRVATVNTLTYLESLRTGSPIFLLDSNNQPYHSGICVGFDGEGFPLINAHTRDRWRMRWGVEWTGITVQITENSRSSLSISDEVYPTGRLNAGSSFGLRGVITSNYKLTDVSAWIHNGSGNLVMEYHHNPNSYRYDIRTDGLNDAFIFGRLPTGYYTYAVDASDSSGITRTLISNDDSMFEIGNHTKHIKGAYQWYEAAHPHYNYWKCSVCGELFTDGSTAYVDTCEICNPPAPAAPGAPSVTVSGYSVTVSWNAVANATHYDVYLVQEPWRWEDIKYSSGSVTQTSFTFDNVAVGTYNAFVISRPNENTVQSGWTSLSVNAPTYYLDVNAYLDGASAGGLGDYGTVDVYINGSLVADDVSDYYAEWPSGTSYEIKDIKPKPGYSYDGLREGTRVGAIGSGTVNLAFAFSSVDASGVSAPRAEGTFNNHAYLFCDKEVTWYAAKRLCEFMGGHLVTISSEEENQFVQSLRGESRVWLGATHASGAWEWITGEAFSYEKWAEGEWNNATDNDEGSENYAEQAYWDGTWNDLPGYVPRGFVCEIDAPVSVENGIYMISSAVDGRALDVSGASMEQGANIQTWENLGIDSQRFAIAKEGDYYTIAALHSGMAMDVEGAVASSCVNVSQCPLNGNDAQKWMFEDAGDGYVYIHSALGFYLDVCGAEAKNGANIWTYQFNGGSAQKFRLERACPKRSEQKVRHDGSKCGILRL